MRVKWLNILRIFYLVVLTWPQGLLRVGVGDPSPPLRARPKTGQVGRLPGRQKAAAATCHPALGAARPGAEPAWPGARCRHHPVRSAAGSSRDFVGISGRSAMGVCSQRGRRARPCPVRWRGEPGRRSDDGSGQGEKRVRSGAANRAERSIEPVKPWDSRRRSPSGTR